jgi:hypothetical protein
MLSDRARLFSKVIVWINPEKGYITPLIEEYFDGKPIVRYESKNYFQDKHSGVWFPQLFIETNFDEKGKQRSKDTYEVNIEKTSFNIDISDDEFVFDVPAGWSITDKQNGIRQDYRVVRNTKLKFNEKGRIAFRESRDFIPDYPFFSLPNAANLMTISWTRKMCLVFGMILLMYALYRLSKELRNNKGEKK